LLLGVFYSKRGFVQHVKEDIFSTKAHKKSKHLITNQLFFDWRIFFAKKAPIKGLLLRLV